MAVGAITPTAVPVLEGLPKAGAGCGLGLASKLAYTVSRMFGEDVARRAKLLETKVVLLLNVPLPLKLVSTPPQYSAAFPGQGWSH